MIHVPSQALYGGELIDATDTEVLEHHGNGSHSLWRWLWFFQWIESERQEDGSFDDNEPTTRPRTFHGEEKYRNFICLIEY